jgi:hypothetical protein
MAAGAQVGQGEYRRGQMLIAVRFAAFTNIAF